MDIRPEFVETLKKIGIVPHSTAHNLIEFEFKNNEWERKTAEREKQMATEVAKLKEEFERERQ